MDRKINGGCPLHHHSKPAVVRLKQWEVKEESGQCDEFCRLICNDSSMDESLLASVTNYLNNGVVLLDIEETELETIMARVGDQMVSNGILQTFNIKHVTNKFLLMHHSTLDSEERKSDGISLKNSETVDIEKLIGSEDTNTLDLQSESDESLGETGLVMIGNVGFLEKPTMSFVRLKCPTYFPEMTNYEFPVRYLLVLLGPTAQKSCKYLEIGSMLCEVLRDEEFLTEVCNVREKKCLLRAFQHFFENRLSHEKKPHREESQRNEKTLNRKYSTSNPLLRTNRLWGGLINDVTRRLPKYKSDILDGLNLPVIAASIFLYFGVLSTAITFGSLMSSKTNNLMGISETLLSTSMVGVVFHLLSSQPLMITGGTGPLLLFDEALYQLCHFYELDFLTIRIYIGIWLGIVAVAIAAFDGCVYLRLLTRFTQELFASLISLIFMMEAIFKVIEVFKTHPISERTNDTMSSASDVNYIVPNNSDTINDQDLHEPNTALFCTILSVGTFVLAYCLRVFRNSHFLGRGIRRALGDFGVPISIATFVYLSSLVPQIYTEKLIVPEGLSPTNPNVRSWIIPFNAVPVWAPFVAAIAALLVYVLIFMETQISELILDSRNLKKGSGFHVDIVIICLMNLVCGFLGLPWQSGATIRSVTHVSAVTTVEDRPAEKGEAPKLVVKEQRVSGLIISLAVGLSVIMAPILRIIPASILYGVFFYMGIVSISGVQFLHRVRLLLTPTKYHGTEAYVQRVPTWKMHVFTFIQIIALCVLWIVKSSRLSLALPFVLLLMIPLKQKISSYYSASEMTALDGNLPEVDVKDEPDFYEQSHLPG
ncbi:Band 3 anion transport protein [Pseudolycoriella hygida]|uniref:Anion exchange protein n=1 Tax=Pseudolycoriella hygida TaxID=35572 RepID=A0A9Q0NFU5_9DIPT|nr:Band 3 anion transport protein [Pseudolycoriella hygida]